MKKVISVVIAILIAMACLAGCGRDEYDPTTIKVIVFNGGYGTAWFDDLAEKFNETSEVYKIKPIYKKVEAKDIIVDVQTGRPDADVYFSCGVDFQQGIVRDYFEDLSDILTMKPDGESGGTVADKMVDLELWKQVSSKRGEGMYIFPHTETMMGMVIDYQQFVENGWLEVATSEDESSLINQGITFEVKSNKYKFVSSTSSVNYKEGDTILKAGKDGIFGTYDDGQPTNMADFDEMLRKITNGNKNANTFLFSGLAENYLNDIIGGVLAQYIGVDNYNIFFDFNSEGKEVAMHNGQAKSITVDTGYEVFKSEAVYQALNFVEKYLASDKVDDKVLEESSYSHTDAQNDFLLSYKKATGFPTILCEGTWWENEARAMFDSIAREKPERAFGKREYRYLLYPYMEGQATEQNKSVMGGAEYAGVVVAKQKDADKLSVIKKFLAFSTSNENLVNFTKYSGCKKYFKYSMTDSDLNSLTPFAKNTWELMTDTENVTIVPSRIYQSSNPLTYTTTYIANCYIPLYTGTIYTMYPARYFRSIATISELYGTGAKSGWIGYSESQWQDFIADARAQGYFNN